MTSRNCSVWALLRLRLAIALMVVWLPSLTANPMCTSHAEKDTLLSGQESHRVIVRLRDPPLASMQAHPARYARGLDLETAQAASYVQRLEQAQQLVAASIERVLPGAMIERTYRIAFNGLSVRLPRSDAGALQALSRIPGVRAVYEEATFAPTLYASVPAIDAPSLWTQLGGSDVAGAGVKIAILDSGIDISHPMFDGDTFTYPNAFPKGDGRYTTPKVIVARAYFRPTDPPLPSEASPVPGAHGSGHGTHIASIAAGNAVTATYHGLSQELSGVAPRAWLMNYRIFYPTESGLEAAYTTEILQAIEDAVADGADVICGGWASVSPRLPFASPVAEALDVAIEAGCVVVAAVGNDGPAYGSASRIPGGIERVISVGSASKDRIVGWDFCDVTGPGTVHQDLQGQPFARALFGAEIEDLIGPLPYMDVADAAADDSSLACEPLLPGRLTGKVALIGRGECYFADKVCNAQQAGAALALIYDDSGEAVEMGCAGEHCDPGEPGIAGWQMTLADGHPDQTTETQGSEGAYTFTVCSSGVYTLSEEERAGWEATTATTRAITIACDHDEGPFDFGNRQLPGPTPTTVMATPTPLTPVPTLPAPTPTVTPSQCITICGHKWHDYDADGVWDSPDIVIPAAMVSQSFGGKLLAWLDDHPGATLQLDPNGRIVSAVADLVQSSSARGPAYMRYLKPDLVAPGASVLSAYHDSADGGATYAQLTGSSMACAHVVGAAALLLQAHPTWNHDQVKAALMATARTAGIGIESSPSSQASILARGSGLVSLADAAETPLLFTPPSLTVSQGAAGSSHSLQLVVKDTRETGDSLTYATTISATEGIIVSAPTSVTIGANGTTTLTMAIEIAAGAAPGDQEAELHLMHGQADVHLPIWVHVEPLASAADVLLIDNDFSLMESYVNYAPYVTTTLEALNYSYQVWNADAHFSNPQTIPDLEYLQQFDVVIWLTGDHAHADGYYVVSTPLTGVDLQVLASYLDGGGRLLALGQNLAEASDVNPSEDPTWGRAEFYHNYLGAHWLQGSLFDPQGEGLYPPSLRPSLVGMPGTFLAGVVLDIGQEGDGDGTQTSVDEIGPGGLPDGLNLDLVQPVMMALESSPLESGYVAVAKACEPTLEGEQPSCLYRSAYYSFGFERVNNNPGVSTRAQLLDRTLDWLLDRMEVAVDQAAGSPNDLTRITCQATSSVTTEIASYRWRIGEGENAQTMSSTEPFIAHIFPSRGNYDVWVEATDALGHKALGQGTVSIVDGGSSTLTVTPATALPGGVLTYDVVARNTTTAPLPITFTLPVPSGTDYVAHSGGEFEAKTLSRHETLAAGKALTTTLRARIQSDISMGTEITATAYFQTEHASFTKTATVEVLGRTYLPMIVKE